MKSKRKAVCTLRERQGPGRTHTGERPGKILRRLVPMCPSTSLTSSGDAIFMEMLHFSVSTTICNSRVGHCLRRSPLPYISLF